MLTHLPGEIPIVNRSGETIPAGSLAVVDGRDGTATEFWKLAKPTAADQLNICVVPEAIASNAKGVGLMIQGHPRQIKHSLGGAPTAGVTYLGTAAGSWAAAAGTTLLCWGGDATWATVVMQPKAAGTAPWTPSAAWTDYEGSPVASTWYDMEYIDGFGNSGAGFIKSRRAGTVIGLSVIYTFLSADGVTGKVRFTVGSDAGALAGAPITEWIDNGGYGIRRSAINMTSGSAVVAQGTLLVPRWQVDDDGAAIKESMTAWVALDICP